LFDSWNDALLFRTLATLRKDVPVFDSIDELWWKGPRNDFVNTAERLKAPDLAATAKKQEDLRAGSKSVNFSPNG
jgi:hypothetical protein